MKNYVLLFAVILLVSCNPREEKESCDVVDLTPFQNEEVSDDIAQCVEDVQLIALETSDSSLIMGHLQNVIVDDDRIVIEEHQVSRQPVKIFDRKGQFIASVKTGQGPGEVSMVYAMAVDRKQRQILVYHDEGIMYYDYDGKYIKDDKIDFATQLHNNINIANLLKYLDILNQREKEIICMRYGLFNCKEATQKEIAKKFKISRSYVSRIEKRALIKLLNQIRKAENDN